MQTFQHVLKQTKTVTKDDIFYHVQVVIIIKMNHVWYISFIMKPGRRRLLSVFLYEGLLLPLPSSPFCATKLPFFSTMLYLIFIYIIFFIQIFQLVFRFQPVFVYSQNIVIYFARYHCYHSDFLASAGFFYTSLQSPRSPLVL